MNASMRFVWFWTFWHWSGESFRGGALLRGPLQGLGGHWDEWYRHEASANDRRAIEATGRTESAQRQFIAWLHLHWSREAGWSGNRLIPRFVLCQLAHLAPFNTWRAFDEYRDSYGLGGVSAVVLAADSTGHAEDVRPVEALTLPSGIGPRIVSEGFQAGAADLETPRHAASSLLSGRGLWLFLGLWIVGGRRPYPRWVRAGLSLGWLGVGGVILYLLFGPESGDALFSMAAILLGLWSTLLVVAVAVVVQQGFCAWRQGQAWSARLDQSQVRLRMNGGLTVKGGSAGLPFCLNILLSLYRASPGSARRSWLWRELFCRMRSGAESWAATGTVTVNGWLKPVVLEPKLRACLQQAGVGHILTPRQADASRGKIESLIDSMTSRTRSAMARTSGAALVRLGFAAEKPALASHQCRHAAQALMAVGELNSRWQKGFGFFGLLSSCVMLWALPDLRGILAPPSAPEVVAPSSPSPYHLWVSLDTVHPRHFQVVLESWQWSNRRETVARYSGAGASVRAEILLHRLAGRTAGDGEDGTVWIERRRRFLNREYAPGERVGRYSLAYLNQLAHE